MVPPIFERDTLTGRNVVPRRTRRHVCMGVWRGGDSASADFLTCGHCDAGGLGTYSLPRGYAVRDTPASELSVIAGTTDHRAHDMVVRRASQRKKAMAKSL